MHDRICRGNHLEEAHAIFCRLTWTQVTFPSSAITESYLSLSLSALSLSDGRVGGGGVGAKYNDSHSNIFPYGQGPSKHFQAESSSLLFFNKHCLLINSRNKHMCRIEKHGGGTTVTEERRRKGGGEEQG